MLLPRPAADDSALISAALGGDAAAFEQLFDRYYAMIHAFAYRLCLRAADAEDIAQETFIKSARALASFRGGDFRSWLYRIAANCARDAHRSAARRGRVELAATNEMLAAGKGPGRSEGAAEVHDALAQLSPDHREAVVLVYLEGMNHAQASRVLGCAETTVSWRLFRAKRQLKAILSRAS